MNYYIVPVTNGLLDIDYAYLAEGIQNTETSCYVALRAGVLVREPWQAITEEQFNVAKESMNEPPE